MTAAHRTAEPRAILIDLMVDERSKAREAVIGDLRRFGLTDPKRLNVLADRFVTATGQPATTPARAEQAVGLWFAQLLGDRLVSPEQAALVGRAAFLLADGPRCWPGAFLADGPAPAGLVAALRLAAPLPMPAPISTSMTAQPLDMPKIHPSLLRLVPRLGRTRSSRSSPRKQGCHRS